MMLLDRVNPMLCRDILACIATPDRTASVVDAKGKRALKISEGEGMGVVWLDGYDFANGVIEIDMLGRSQPVQGSFLGVAFRVTDAQTQDAVSSGLSTFARRTRFVIGTLCSTSLIRSGCGKSSDPSIPAITRRPWFPSRTAMSGFTLLSSSSGRT